LNQLDQEHYIMTNEIVLSIPTMACQGCVTNIDKALQDRSGINNYDIDLPTKTVRIDSVLPQEELIAALKSAGYEAAPVK
jgi:copper chaperone CopZ